MSSSTVPTAPAVVQIRARSSPSLAHLGEMWTRRELLAFLVWRDLKIRYKQTALGAMWALFQPLLAMVVFSIFFGRLAHIPSEGVPYFLFTYAALIPWLYHANALSQSSNSLVDNERVISKVYFPRLMLPLSPVISGLVDIAVSLVMLVVIAWVRGFAPSWRLLVLPLVVLLGSMLVFAVGMLLSALNVKFRDVKYILPFLVQVWLFGSPIVYGQSLVPEAWRDLYAANPMVLVVGGFRWAILGVPAPGLATIGVGVGVTALLFVVGLVYFSRAESTFSDVV